MQESIGHYGSAINQCRGSRFEEGYRTVVLRPDRRGSAQTAIIVLFGSGRPAHLLKRGASMEKRVGAYEARRHLGQILKEVSGRGDRYVLEYHGEPVAAVVPMAVYEGWKRRREAFFDRLEEMAATADRSPGETEALASEVVRAARGD